MSKYEAVYFVGDNQAINCVRVDSSKNEESRRIFGLACSPTTYNTLASRGVTRKSLHTAAAYPCIIHSIHRMLSGGNNKILAKIAVLNLRLVLAKSLSKI